MSDTSQSASGDAVLLVGAGRMGGALLRGWLKSRRFSSIVVVDPQPSEMLTRYAGEGRIRLLDHCAAEEVGRVAAAVIAVKPQVMKTEGTWLDSIGRSSSLVLSIAAGVTTHFLTMGAGRGCAVVRAMPNTPGAIGRGITALYASPAVGAENRALAEALMAPLGQTLWLTDEALMDVVTAVSGSGPAYVFLLAEALAQAGVAQGLDSATAERLARATVAGAGALLETDGRSADELRKEVTSPGGTTEAALRVLMAETGLVELMRRAVEAAARRGRELGA